ncbi:MAG: cysteine desulfurase [Planctomycetes bacterium]|nr:cysteine desulfurase [Planctomycetota bacterium]
MRQPAQTAGSTPDALDVQSVRADFPILSRTVHGKPLVYLDNGASTQKPQAVIDAVRRFYEHDYANIHRAVHELSQAATEAYENARRTVQRFLRAESEQEIVFVRGTTEGINLVAGSWGRANLGPGDEVLITAMEHHSNIVPWQMLCAERGARLVVAPMDQTGALIWPEFEKRLNSRTKLLGVVHVSNALGTVNPVRRMADAAHAVGARVLVDGAQAVAHAQVDVNALGADFYVFSGHKIFGPTGVGVLWGKADLLEAMPPWQGGGDMIRSVSFEKTEYAPAPAKFEAGTPHIAGGIGLAAALDYVTALGLPAIAAWEHELVRYAHERLAEIPGLRFIGTAPRKAAVVSFVLDGIHATDAGMILDQEGIAVRAGHHCAEPVMRFFGVPGTIRASFAFYNTRDEVDALVAGVRKVQKLFA